jgi:Flp pilus assembly pilin Flp
MTRHAAAVVTVNLLAAHDAVRRRLADERGQGTVEYVGLILLVAGVLAAVVVYGKEFSGDELGKKVTDALGNAIETPGKGKP